METDASEALTRRRNDLAAEFAGDAATQAAASGWEPSPSAVAFRQLAVLTRATHSSSVLEFGTGTGIGSLAIVSAFGLTGRLDTVEPDAARAAFAAAGFKRFGIEDRVRIHRTRYGDAVSGMGGPFDLIVISRDPVSCLPIYEDLVRLLRIGGSLVLPAAPDRMAAPLLDRLADDSRLLPYFAPGLAPILAVRTR